MPRRVVRPATVGRRNEPTGVTEQRWGVRRGEELLLRMQAGMQLPQMLLSAGISGQPIARTVCPAKYRGYERL